MRNARGAEKRAGSAVRPIFHGVVLLTVVDDKGDRASASAAVKVTELPVPASLEPRVYEAMRRTAVRAI